MDNSDLDAIVREVVRRIVTVASPEKIILFGSACRGQPTVNSDLDVLVVKAGADRRQLAGKIYQHLIGVGRAVDVIVVTPEDIARFGNSPALVIYPALREGKVVYDTESVAA